MRTNVVFRCAQEFVGADQDEGILGVRGAVWFVEKLKRIPGLAIDQQLIQEDWGVVIFSQKNEKRFWIGLSLLPDGENHWLAHVHHASWALLQRFTTKGRAALDDLVKEIDVVLKADATVTDVRWCRDEDV
jgi:hypothetical protein